MPRPGRQDVCPRGLAVRLDFSIEVQAFFMLRFTLIVLLALPAGALAQTADTTVALPEVEVEAERAATASAAGRITTLGRAAFERTGAETVADILDARTGLSIKQYGSGGLATLSQRGLGSAHTVLLLDGLRIADPQTGQVDLSLLPTVLLDRVEVAYGTASAMHGAEALGGTVRLHTLDAAESARLRLTAGAGAYGARRLGGVVSGGDGRFSGVVAAEVSRADGAFPYRNDALFPPEEVRRTGADRSLATLFGRIVYRPEGRRLAVAAWLNRAERGLPGPGNATPGDARQWDRHARAWAAYEHRLPRGTLDLKASIQQTTLRYANPLAGIDETARPRTVDLDARLRLAVAPRGLAAAGVAAGHDRAALRGGVQQTRLGAFLHATADFGRLLLYPAVRLDAYRTEGITTHALSPRLGLNVRAARRLRLKASLGRAFRAPTFNERFWQPGGNPALRPERGWSSDAGIHFTAGTAARRVEADVSFFAAHLRDQITWAPAFVDPSVQVWRPGNLRRVVTRGLEATASGAAQATSTLHFDGGLTYTVTDARDRSMPEAASYGAPLRYVPRQQLKLFVGMAWRAFRIDAAGQLVGRRPLTSDGTMHLPAYRVFEVQASVQHRLGPARLVLAFALENAFDARYTVVRRYPMPPRHARLRLTLDVDPSS